MQIFIDHTYNKFSGLYDEHFDRLLNEALQAAATIIMSSTEIQISDVETDGLFYNYDHLSRRDTDKKDQNQKEVQSSSVPDMIAKMNEVSNDQYTSIEFAIEYLIILLHRTGFLRIVSTDIPRTLILRGIEYANFKHGVIEKIDLAKSVELKDAERHVLDLIALYNPPYVALLGKNIYDPIPIVKDDNGLGVDDGLNTLINNNVYWQRLEGVAENAQPTLLKAITDQINTLARTPIDSNNITYAKNKISIALADGRTLDIVLLYREYNVAIDDSTAKTFVLQSPQVRKYKEDPRGPT